jgi:hypothetical protein
LESLEASTWTTVQTTSQNSLSHPQNTSSYRDRRLITPTTVVKTLDSISIRNNINNALKSANLNIMVATVTMSQSKFNIVITTLPDTTAEDLLKHQKIWQHVLDFTKVKKRWKVVQSSSTWHFHSYFQQSQWHATSQRGDRNLQSTQTSLFIHWLTSEEVKVKSTFLSDFGLQFWSRSQKLWEIVWL